MKLKPRHAIFFAPADDSPLGIYGATVLRRRATDPGEWTNPQIPVNFDNTAVWRACVETPARYGFHATLQAPFELHPAYTYQTLLDELEVFCSQQQPLLLTELAPRRTRRFDALAFDTQPLEVKEFASTCVQRFNKYCAPLHPQDIVRRQKKALSPTQLSNLEQYGYPYIFDDFNFHMTLSGTMPDDDNGHLQWLRVLFDEMVTETPLLDRLCVFYQADRNEAFVRIAEFKFPV